MWMNEHEIEDALRRYHGHPVLGPAARTLDSLATAVNGCSDGWPYWQAPSRAAARLMSLIQDAYTADRNVFEFPQETAAHRLKQAYAQLRRFRTRYPKCEFRIYAAPGVPGDAEPEQPAAPVSHRIRLTVRGDRATVTVIGDGPLPTGTYHGTVVPAEDTRQAS
jgi:hypothetical protein